MAAYELEQDAQLTGGPIAIEPPLSAGVDLVVERT